MAIGRSRNSKRPSYSSYTSTITTIVFIILCVLGVWMLTSNSITSPQTIRHTTSVASSKKNDLPSSNDKKDLPAYEDNPRELPNDAIKSDDPRQIENGSDDSTNSEDNGQNKVVEVDTVAGTTNPTNGAISNGDKEQETTSSITRKKENNGGRGVEADESVVEKENPKVKEEEATTDLEAEKKSANINQVSEESAINEAQAQQQTDNSDVVQRQENQDVANSQETNEYQQQQQQQGTDPTDDITNSNNFKEQESTNQDQASSINEEQQAEQKNQEQAHGKVNEDRVEKTGEENSQSHGHQDVILDMDQQKQIEEQLRKQRKEDQQNLETNLLASDEIGHSQKPIVSHTIKEKDSQNDEKFQQEMEQKKHQAHSQQSEAPSNDENSRKPSETDEGRSELNLEQSFKSGDNEGIPKESKESKKSWLTQATQSENQKERRKTDTEDDNSIYGYTWQLCNITTGPDYIPCLDNDKALRRLRSTKHFEHRERHCPEEGPTCLLPCPGGYKRPIEWPKSREKIWYHNVPHPMLANVKGHQNWVKVSGELLTFPGGGTQFIHGAMHYIDFLQKSVPNIKWGKHTRVVLDVGCGVASFGGYLFERDVLTMSFAPKDEHEAQVQLALERGIPAISAVMGSQRLPFPSRVFDLVHCARCRVPWHAEGGRLLLELNRVLRPGGFFIWSATPVYQKLEEDVQIWKEMTSLTTSMCWELVTVQKDKLNSVGAAIYRKSRNNECYEQRKQKMPPMCKGDDDPNAAWYVPIQACMHKVPMEESDRGFKWPVVWPRRLRTPPAWLNSSQMGIYGKPAPQDFISDYEHWQRVVSSSYMSGLGISWSGVRNVMDMRAVYGGLAAALKDLQMWVLNVVNVDSADTLPIIYERGLFGIYHYWCESFNTYPRTYDLLHADHLFSKLKKRCKLVPVMAEVDRIVRPGGKIIVRDESSAIGEVENLLRSLHWEVHLTFSKDYEGILSAQKGSWRPETYADKS